MDAFETRKLMEVLHIQGPIEEYKILLMATERIKALEAALKVEHEDCIRIAREVLPDKPMHFAHQAAWAMNYEICRLRSQISGG